MKDLKGDYLVKAISESGVIRGYVALTTSLVNDAYQLQKPAPLAGIVLGRVLTAAALMGATVKGRERISLNFRGNGPLRAVRAESDSEGRVRGYVAEPRVDFRIGQNPHDELCSAVGRAGILTVTKDLGMKVPYSGSVNLASGETGEDLAHYLMESEQIPSVVSVGAIPNDDNSAVFVAGGFLLQVIPSVGGVASLDESDFDTITKMVRSCGDITSALLRGGTPESILQHIFAGIPYKILEIMPLHFHCDCSQDTVISALKILGEESLRDIQEQEMGAEVVCEFCQKQYFISHEKIKQIVE